MSSRPQSRSTSESKLRPLLWVGVFIALLVFIVVAVIVWQRTAFPFKFASGDEQVIVLLRNTQDAEYELEFTGNEPINLQRVIIQLESNQLTLHVDVQQVTVIVGDQQVVMDDSGRTPEGTELLLQPGETFKVRVTYLGDTIGAHYIYGFRLGYESNGVYNEDTLNINDREFIVAVE